MDPAYISAIAALAGSAIGGVTSFGTTWMSRRAQMQAEHRERDKTHRQELYKEFIGEASRLYGDGITHEALDVAELRQIYAMISLMRILSSEPVILAAERMAVVIAEAYLAPNQGLSDIASMIGRHADPLRAFSEACRQELLSEGYL